MLGRTEVKRGHGLFTVPQSVTIDADVGWNPWLLTEGQCCLLSPCKPGVEERDRCGRGHRVKSPQGPHGTRWHSLLLAVLLGQLGSLFCSRSEPAFPQGHRKSGGALSSIKDTFAISMKWESWFWFFLSLVGTF